MRRAIATFSLAVLFAVVLVACGGGSAMISPSGSNAGMAPVSLTIHDSPPAGVTVLSFEITVTGASLQPSNMSMQAVPLMARPAEIELEHLQTESALLANVSVAAGTYNGVTVTFANPEMTIQNQTGNTLTVNGQSCANGQVCEVIPKLNQAMVSVQAPKAPFPITLSSTSPLALDLDFNVDASVQSADLSITPSVSVKQLPIPAGGEMEMEETDFAGRITAIDQTNKTFMLQLGFSGQSQTIATDSNTQFDFGSTCSANNFSCLMVGEFVKVQAGLTAPGATPLAKQVELLVPGLNQFAVEGLMSNVNVAQNQFQMVVRDVEGEFVDIAQPIIPFGPITVQVAPQATFSINTNNLTLPAGLSLSVSDMVIGQGVEIHPIPPFMITGTPPSVTVNTDQVRLEPSPVTATVSAINSGPSPQNFVLGNLPTFFTSNGITSIQVDVLSTTQFFNDPMGLTGLNVGDLISSGGLLFNNTASPSTPIRVAEKVVKRFPDGTG